MPMPEMVTTKPYDWTYTVTYAGSSDDAESGNAQYIVRQSRHPLLL